VRGLPAGAVLNGVWSLEEMGQKTLYIPLSGRSCDLERGGAPFLSSRLRSTPRRGGSGALARREHTLGEGNERQKRVRCATGKGAARSIPQLVRRYRFPVCQSLRGKCGRAQIGTWRRESLRIYLLIGMELAEGNTSEAGLLASRYF